MTEAKKTAILNFKMRLGAVAQTVKGAGIGHDGGWAICAMLIIGPK